MTDRPRAESLDLDTLDDVDGPDHSTPAYDAGDPDQVNLARRKAGRVAKDKRDFIAKVMADKAGRAWMWELLTLCGVMRSSFIAGDPHATSFNEGQRNVGLRIMASIMSAAPEQYETMVKESA